MRGTEEEKERESGCEEDRERGGKIVDEFRERTKKKGRRPNLFVVRLKCLFTQSFSFASSALTAAEPALKA